MASFEQRKGRIQGRLTRLLRDMVELGRDMGAESPEIFVEGGGGFHLSDGPANEEGGDQKNILFRIDVPIDVDFDCGGW